MRQNNKGRPKSNENVSPSGSTLDVLDSLGFYWFSYFREK